MKCIQLLSALLLFVTSFHWHSARLFSQDLRASAGQTKSLVTAATNNHLFPLEGDTVGFNQAFQEEVTLQEDAKRSLFRPIQDLSLDIRTHRGPIPQSRAGELAKQIEYRWEHFEPGQSFFIWEPPNIGYQPLYFEDVALERYGQTHNPRRQVVSSAVHFGVSFLTLPFHLVVDPSWNCHTPHGYCRPGDIAPYTRPRFLYRW